ncbi:VWA domain-containing protein [Actinacidiphila guanduensis]|uniref:Ca-activated chloride channel family protein n=1 Tax=Actinacidiphila guanduensis TaxID=310781 RepID=A0A1H0C9T4_9ACTN|nr:VWA domain-containing protein [Actinacidiphila guanduensis]SDN54597.1 Ca-activated chloride channel family protein [Actinacidiphila guanduensis]
MIIRKLLAAGSACGLMAALACGLLPATAHAGEPVPGATPKVELVLDVSGSMSAKDIDGQSRMSAAKQAFDDVLDSTPEGVDLGIRTLGANYPGNDRKTGCKDTAQLYPVGQLNRDQAKSAVATLQPTGWTPIGPALLAAAGDIKGGDGTHRLVLITDGEDTCNANPCDVARQIAAEGIDLTIDTLGLIPDAKTRNQLSCIAEATGGTYTTVQHRQQLTTKVKQLVDRSTDTAVTPTATQGAGSCTDAPVLKQGLYSDRETFSENRWYRVQVAPGQELRAAVTVSDDRAVNADYGVLLRGVTLHGREIVRDDESGTGRTDAVSAGIRYPKPDSDDAPAETVCLQVGNSFSAPASVKTEPGLPVELSLDLVPAPHKPSDVAFHGLGRGWWLLGLLAVIGIVAGLLTGWAARWRLTSGRTR